MIQIATLFLSSVAVYSLKPSKSMVNLIKEHAEITSELKSILLITLKIQISLHGYQAYPFRCSIINGLNNEWHQSEGK
jgi:hypothetical protein